MTPSDFNGWPTYILENKFLRIETLAASARIVRLIPAGHPNLFADLGNKTQPTPYGDFYFHGGHRFWHSPEAMPRSYLPDTDGATISEIPGGVRIDHPAEPWTQIAKSMEIRLNPERPQVILRHELRNDGPWTVELAPWALTMMRQGGVGIFPQPQGNVDSAGLLANRQISVWPYTHLNDPRLNLRDDCILISASPSLPPIKIGYFNPHGWQAYWIDGLLFVKRYESVPGANYPDGGCNTETYCNHEFIEMESLGPLEKLAPGGTLIHNETWEIYESLDQPFIPAEIINLLSS
ncbi:MAG: hypothetical protein NTW32_14110 [Chloroflexi bacterium]|nr:hypothetical protein [Chloroflexota bacterium]